MHFKLSHPIIANIVKQSRDKANALKFFGKISYYYIDYHLFKNYEIRILMRLPWINHKEHEVHTKEKSNAVIPAKAGIP